MPTVARSYVTSGVALVGAGIVTAAQLVPAVGEAQSRVIQAAVNLAAAVDTGQFCSGYNTQGCDIWAKPVYTPVAVDPAGSASNIPANLVNALLSMPRAWLDGMNEFSYAQEVTGSWWVYSPTNVLGFDPADPPKITALTDWFMPFKALSHPLGEQTAWYARANLPMNASCTGTVGPTCHDIGPILSKMFLAPVWTLAAGYQFPTLFNPVSDAEGAIGEEIPGETGAAAPWSGSNVKLDPMDPINSVINYLQADPALNAPKPITVDEITTAVNRFVKAQWSAFNPIVPMSYLLKHWPYTILTPLFLPFVPALCPQCDPENPGGPARPQSAAAAATPATTLVSDVSDESAPAADAGPAAAPVEPPAGSGPKDSGVTGVGRENSSAASDSEAAKASSEAAEATESVSLAAPVAADTSAKTPVNPVSDVAPVAAEPAVTPEAAEPAAEAAEPAQSAEPAKTAAPTRRGVQFRSGAGRHSSAGSDSSGASSSDQGGKSVARSAAGRSAESAD